MAEVLAKRVLKLMRGPIEVARGPPFVALVPKDPSVVFLSFDHENASVANKDGVNLSSAAFIRNDDVSEPEELETPRDCLESACRRSSVPRAADQ